MRTLWQISLLPGDPDRVMRFGRIRRAISVVVINDDRGWVVEARSHRKLVERIVLGEDAAQLPLALQQAQATAATAILDSLKPKVEDAA